MDQSAERSLQLFDALLRNAKFFRRRHVLASMDEGWPE